jgi:hypothetical protein
MVLIEVDHALECDASSGIVELVDRVETGDAKLVEGRWGGLCPLATVGRCRQYPGGGKRAHEARR